ncbi:MAG: hypothetical protein QNJ34_21140 [Xenococcaceae cyanobacterium MO_188.B29]|nr:hypothetical protein [Xenococcaceae cyanobacterium MO_188.B29]
MISINELSTSYITEMEAHEVDSIFGGDSLLQNYYGIPDTFRSIAITPIGGTLSNVQESLDLAIDYAGLNGFVSEALHGGSFSYIATPALFLSYDELLPV